MTSDLTHIARRSGLIFLCVANFLFSSFVMYGAWLALASIDQLLRGIISMFVFIFCYAVGAIIFWKVTMRYSTVATVESEVPVG